MKTEIEKEKEILAYTEQSNDELLLVLGDAIPEEAFLGLEVEDDEHKKIVARNWLKGKYSSIQFHICNSEKIRKLNVEDKTFNKVLTISMVGDLLLSKVLANFPAPLAVATMVVREGLHKLCNNIWEN